MTALDSNASRSLFFSCPGRQFRRVKNRGCGPFTALDSNVCRAGGQFRRPNNRGDTGNVVTGSVSSPPSVFSSDSSAGEITQAASPGLRFAEILLGRSYFVILCGRLR